MKQIIQRIRNKRGETLVESMASILIFTFASIIMLTMISTATDINQTAKDADRDHFELLIDAEMAEGSGKSGSVSFAIGAAGSTSNQAVSVDVYGKSAAEGGVYTYYIDEGVTSETVPAATDSTEVDPAETTGGDGG